MDETKPGAWPRPSNTLKVLKESDVIPCTLNPSGRKNDSNKARFDLIPPHALDALADLYGRGAAKYGDRNWEKGLDWNRVYAALQRHANAWHRGEDYDQEDGQHHMMSVVWCALTIYEYQRRGTGKDPRQQFEPEETGSQP